jgi:hypothetical protein
MEGRRMLRTGISFVFSWYLATNGLGSVFLADLEFEVLDPEPQHNHPKNLKLDKKVPV